MQTPKERELCQYCGLAYTDRDDGICDLCFTQIRMAIDHGLSSAMWSRGPLGKYRISGLDLAALD